MRIVIDVDNDPAAPPTGTVRWDRYDPGAAFCGWVDLLRLLETAVDDARQPMSRCPSARSPQATHECTRQDDGGHANER